MADKAADKVTDLKEVKNATVIVAGNSAYVAVVLTNGQKGAIANHLKNKITDKVKSADKHVRTVYVSANPDFVERMQGYGKRIKTDILYPVCLMNSAKWCSVYSQTPINK